MHGECGVGRLRRRRCDTSVRSPNHTRFPLPQLGYTYLHGSKVFAAAPKGSSFSYKLVSMILACTGGGILVPLFINAIPVPMANDGELQWRNIY